MNERFSCLCSLDYCASAHYFECNDRFHHNWTLLPALVSSCLPFADKLGVFCPTPPILLLSQRPELREH